MDEAPLYAFPQAAELESRRLALFEQRLDPLSIRRLERLGIGSGARCLEVGGGRGSITRWLAERVGPEGHVTATDLQLGYLTKVETPNVEVIRHDVTTDTFAEGSFDLIHTRAVLMHVPVDIALLRRMVSWLKPGGWLVLEEPDFGWWMADEDPVWSTHAEAWHRTFPSGAVDRGRSLLRVIHQLDLVDVGADAEVDIIEPRTPLAEFYALSMEAIGPAAVEAGALSSEQAAALVERPAQPEFLGCGFVHVGVWGRRLSATD